MNKRMLKKREKRMVLAFFFALKKKFPLLFKDDVFKFNQFGNKRLYRRKNW